MVRIELLERDKAVAFSPPIDLIPARITPGFQVYLSGVTTIYSLDTGEKAHEGTYTLAVETLSRADFDTPVGRIAGYLITYSSRIDSHRFGWTWNLAGPDKRISSTGEPEAWWKNNGSSGIPPSANWFWRKDKDVFAQRR